MKVAILFCLVATSLANPLWPFDWWGQRSGSCPSESELVASGIIIEERSRCSLGTNNEPLDYTCDNEGEESFKCCVYGELKVCVPSVVTNDEQVVSSTSYDVSVEDQISEAVTKAQDFITKLGKYRLPMPQKQTIISQDKLRWCVSNPCEMTKCTRMVNEFTYNVEMSPRKEWSCVKAESQEQCMFWIEQGFADIMTTREGDVFTANTKFALKPIAYETSEVQPIQGQEHYMNVTFVLKSTNLNIPYTWSDLAGKTTCHAGVDMPASFKAPICHLIQEEVIPQTGDYVESFSDFVQESCVPGILNSTYNKNGTYPNNMVSLCNDHMREFTGINGALQCLNSGKGQVTFVDHKIIKKLVDDDSLRNDYQVVCKDESRPLDEDIYVDENCHVGHIPRPSIFIRRNHTSAQETEIKNLVKRAFELYSSTDPMTDFNLFDSSIYQCERCRRTDKVLNKNLLFLDETVSVKLIDSSKDFAPSAFRAFNTCEALVPKPRAKICVTNVTEYESCLRFKDVAQKITMVKDIAWGCMLANSSMECMKAVHNNSADLIKADLKETFIGGREFKLDPIMSLHHNASVTYNHTFTRTLAVIKTTSLTKFEELIRAPEGQPKYITDYWKLKICSAGLKNVSAFHNPIGWLLANGTIPRVGSVFESVNRFFQATCVPDVKPETWKWDMDLLLGHELNWGFPTLNMYNFTGSEWLLWNTPATWDMFSYNRKVTKNFSLQQLIEMMKLNITVPQLRNRDVPIHDEMLDDLLGVEGLSTMVSELKQSAEGVPKTMVKKFKERMSVLYPNFDGLVTLNEKISTINSLLSRVNPNTVNQDMPLADQVKEKVKAPVLLSIFGRLLELKNDKISSLEEVVSHVKGIPTLTSFKDEDITTVLKHPAILSYLNIYFPRLSPTFVEPFDNVELRQREFNRYTNPLWLSPKIREFLDLVKVHQTEIKKTCESNLPLKFSGYEGSLRCLKSGVADVAFLDEQTLRNQDLLATVGFTHSDLRLLCPNGQVVEIDINLDVAKVCNFGEVQNPTLMTAYNKSASYRWNVTKALMIAHRSPVLPTLFGKNTLMGNDYNVLLPISLLNQTYQTYLGPMMLRSFEALIKPSTYDYFKDHTGICHGETYTNVIKQRNNTCQAMIKDVTCIGTPRPKKISISRFGQKQYKLVPMCSRPSKFVRQMTEFTCDNGYGYVAPIATAVACECIPCEDMIEFNATFTNDTMWKHETTKYPSVAPEDLYHNVTIWGNSSFWYDHTLNKNFELGNKTTKIEFVRDVIITSPTVKVISEINEVVDPEEQELLGTPVIKKTCERVWTGKTWRQEWFPKSENTTSIGSCITPSPLAHATSRIERFRDTMRREHQRLP